MSSIPIAIAPPVITVHHVGREREPVVVIDRATGQRDALVDFAANRSKFVPATEVGSFYPGLLGPAPTAYVDAMVRMVLPLIAAHFTGASVQPARARGNFSLVTLPAEALTPDQRVPHVDSADRLQFATVHFLSATNGDGTRFFRHRATGFETIDAERLPAYRAALDTEIGDLPAAYADGHAGPFEAIDTIDAAPDRLILYRAALLHSGAITTLPADAADPRCGRLTGNLFLQCRTVA
ncbi:MULTISPECIES: DUF6445 family protein [unclassified Sphingomonas]|uniref:DUF6445 family protein n=1 Tax=unclassified Sphingomonas TaxID=196159 RepID=UPI0007008638|nr:MULTISPECIES: DUF6445 family protein [unclassified Sphingomonas]KQM66276.1 hypothetical protein ASE65_14670 [Sphingomonas sp. Leaf16]KQN08732.1 hypothetical protein ASE81_14715 [Sphingomonas sp. Leaf29]KQN17312.1 hypothetical protein ASE83_14650 [Sphingomonas sp. Leaf32]